MSAHWRLANFCLFLSLLLLVGCTEPTEGTVRSNPALPTPEPTIDVSEISPVFREAARRINLERDNPPRAKYDLSGLNLEGQRMSRKAYWDEHPIMYDSDMEELVEFLRYLDFRIRLIERGQ